MTLVEVKDVELPDAMRRAMARQAESERDRRAKVIHALGEKEAAETLAEAARLLGERPAAMQLRVLETMTEIASEQNSTLIFPLPMELLRVLDTMRGIDTGSRYLSEPNRRTLCASPGRNATIPTTGPRPTHPSSLGEEDAGLCLSSARIPRLDARDGIDP